MRWAQPTLLERPACSDGYLERYYVRLYESLLTKLSQTRYYCHCVHSLSMTDTL